ncbi:MAG: HEAT repeat domain-containing protein [Chloroflexota bacterium]
MSAPVLLTDPQMQSFIREGYIVLRPDMPSSYHSMIYNRIEKIIEDDGNPRNNLLPAVPELMDLFEHPVVHGAMSSILGPDYFLNFHRHVHDRPPGGKDQKMHKDSLHNSRFAVDKKTRHHHTRWTMLLYYPQNTPVLLGPTGIVPKSQYLNIDWPADEGDTPLDGDAGTVVIIHYDLLHRGMANHHDSTVRQMVKFLFTRMSEPTEPTWDYTGSDWVSQGHVQNKIWEYQWNWHRGVAGKEELAPTTDDPIDDLIAQLGVDTEIDAMTAGYELGRRGEQAVPALINALSAENAGVSRNAYYAFNQIGEAALPALVDLTQHEEKKVRARAYDVLGDMGLNATTTLPTLLNGLNDAEDGPRQRAAEALGTAGYQHADVAKPLADKLVNDESGMVRRNAAFSLARMGANAADAVPALAKGMLDSNHYVRGYSVHALSRIGTTEAAQAALDHLQTMRWDREGVAYGV